MIPNVPSRADRLAAYVESCPGSGAHHITVQECNVCGLFGWVSTETAGPAGVTVVPLSSLSCPRCIGAHARAPEVFQWVLATLVKHEQGDGHVA